MKIDLQKSVSRFRTREKILRVIWNFTWMLFRFLPRPASILRILVLRVFGAKIGKRCLIEPGVKIWLPWNLKMDDFVALGRNVEIYNYGLVTIGTMSVVSQYSYICTGTHDFTHPHMPLVWYPISIGNECWIAAGSWILPNVTIGDGVVVGARSTVTKDLPDWTVCVGHPCKPFKKRILSQ